LVGDGELLDEDDDLLGATPVLLDLDPAPPPPPTVRRMEGPLLLLLLVAAFGGVGMIT
jgi:hypothetical protein